MEYSYSYRFMLVCSVLVLCLNTRGARCQLSDDFYDYICPDVYTVVQQHVYAAMRTEMRMGASLLRLHFHDCFVNVYINYPFHTSLNFI
jgi:peroxidase